MPSAIYDHLFTKKSNGFRSQENETLFAVPRTLVILEPNHGICVVEIVRSDGSDFLWPCSGQIKQSKERLEIGWGSFVEFRVSIIADKSLVATTFHRWFFQADDGEF